jgi:hypothetical protein
MESDSGEERRDCSISLARANLIVLLGSPPLAAAMYLLYVFLAPSLARLPEMDAGRWMLYLALLIAGITLHEVLHALGWIVAGRLPVSAAGFGFKLRTMTPYAHLRSPVPARTYRFGILLPLLILGLPPYLLGLLLGNQALMFYGMFFTLAAGGDLLVLWLLRGVPGTSLVEDHPSRAGCWVYR